MKDKVVNKLLETLFSGDKSEEDMVYVQVKFALEVLLNNLGKLAVVLVFSLVTGSWAETGITFLSYICIRRYAYGLHSDSEFVCLLWTLLYLYGFDAKTTFYETKHVFYFFSIEFVVEVRMR